MFDNDVCPGFFHSQRSISPVCMMIWRSYFSKAANYSYVFCVSSQVPIVLKVLQTQCHAHQAHLVQQMVLRVNPTVPSAFQDDTVRLKDSLIQKVTVKDTYSYIHLSDCFLGCKHHHHAHELYKILVKIWVQGGLDLICCIGLCSCGL